METGTNSTAANSEKNQPERVKSFKKFFFVFVLVNLGFLAVLAKVFLIQVVDVDKYREMARRQHESRIKLSPERGNIYDRNGMLVSSTFKSTSYAADPTILSDKKDRALVCRELSAVTDIPFEKLMERLGSAKGSFVWLARGVMTGGASPLDSLKLRGLIKVEEPKRNFLYGQVAAQVVGCTDIDNKGITGVEMGWDSILSGKTGYTVMLRDATGRLMPVAAAPPVPAENGKSLQLTIDMELQRIVEYELKQGVEKAGAASGTVVAMEPSTGEILAMASYPTYNPANLAESPEGSMRNRAVTDVYEPGSTFKLITAAAAIEENQMTPKTIVDGCNGQLQYKDIIIRDDHPLGMVTFAEALAKSSNIVFSTVASNLSGNKFYKYIRDFGFGLSLGIDIPGEVPGKIRKATELDAGSKRFIGFGYGLAATPLQILNAYATVANSGQMMKPHLVKKVFDSDGDLIYEARPEKVRKVVSDKTARTLTDMLCGVVDNGTGNNAKISGMRVAGKTGTAQQLVDGSYKTKNYTASFVGFLPAYNPKIAIIVVLDKPMGDYYGGSTAAPLFRNIAQRWLLINHDMFPAQSEGVQYAADTTGLAVPSVTGLLAMDAKNLLRQYGFRVTSEIDKHSVISSQSPKAGTKLSLGSVVDLYASGKNKTADGKPAQAPRPDVRGLAMRRALNILHSAGYKAKVTGSGTVASQFWMSDANGKPICVISGR